MYSVWFCDLKKVIEVMENIFPNFLTFCSIEGNCYGDFVIKTDTNTYIIKHEDYSIWKLNEAGNYTQIH